MRLIHVLGLLALAGCGTPPELAVDQGYIRLNAVPDRPAVAYFTVHGGPADATLIDVGSPVSIRSEMHESMAAGGMTTMKPLDRVPIRAGSTTAFAPGGKHVMLFGMNPGIKPGQRVMLTFTFSNNQRIEFSAPTIAAGAAPPAE